MNVKRVLLYITPLLLLGDLILGKYSLLLLHKEFPVIIVRNWLFVGIPCFTIGNVIQEKKDWIEKHVSKFMVIAGVVLFSCTSIMERYLLATADLNVKREHYISTTFLAAAVFLSFLYFADNRDSLTARIGRRDSTWTYILHYLVISVLGFVMQRVGVEDVYNIVRPVIVFLTTTALVDLTYKIKITRSQQ